ncbi:MAG TPA: biopolymer transporter ExbD [Candidatus Limnocylindrales bacterium]|nr:biopolymer transporter ExbD [Candidatus Limnocylindrales bacterium]
MAFSKLPGKGRGHVMAEINITPLTDIFLVLLIIFMVTSVAMVDTGAKVMLPEVDNTQAAPREITVTVTPMAEIYVNDTLVTLETLEGTLRDLIATRGDMPVVLQGDREVLLGDAVRILAAAQRAGATQVAIAAERGRPAQ